MNVRKRSSLGRPRFSWGDGGSPIDVLPMADAKDEHAVCCLRVDDPIVANAQLEETAKLSGEGDAGVEILGAHSFQSLNDAACGWFIQAFEIAGHGGFV